MSVPRVIVLMGISGSGKSTIGRQLGERLGWPFYDGDDFHPAENVAKMARGVPLDDHDRLPWLQAMHEKLSAVLASGGQAVLAASLLKQAYRDQVLNGLSDVALVYLKAKPALIDERLQQRQGHFFKSPLLASQLAILEEPPSALALSVDTPSADIVANVVETFGLTPPRAHSR
jgi:carbohydrate kinase (thermoresistant glucokinase family)